MRLSIGEDSSDMSKATLSAEVMEALGRIDSPTVANAIEHFKVRDRVAGFASLEARCQFPDLAPMVGYAVTCIADSTAAGDSRPWGLHELLDVVNEAPKPAVVVIQYVGSDRLRSCFVGDVMCAAFQKYGVTGVVSDGGVRDLAGVRKRAPGFQIFSPGTVVAHGYGTYLEFNRTVSVAGLTIEPGDLLHGDGSGLLKVPIEIAAETVDQARAVRKKENEFFEYLESGSFSHEGVKNRVG